MSKLDTFQKQNTAAAALTSAPSGILQRKCASCGNHTVAGAKCDECANEKGVLQRKSSNSFEQSEIPSIVHEVLNSSGQPLDSATRASMEPRFGHDFSGVRVHTDAKAAESAKSVNALAYTVGRDVVFGNGQFTTGTTKGQQLLAHELTHVVQQSNSNKQSVNTISKPNDSSELEADQMAEKVMRQQVMTDDWKVESKPETSVAPKHSVLQRQGADETTEPSSTETAESDASASKEGIEVDPSELMLLPKWDFSKLGEQSSFSPVSSLTGAPVLQRQGVSHCDTPDRMNKVTSGSFVGGKTLDDYFPDLVGTRTWGSNNTAGPFDNGFRAGSSVQLLGYLRIPCDTTGTPTTLGQTVTIVRMKGNGRPLMENGKALEGQTLDDIARSRRDQSKAPFRQTWVGTVSMADPISGAPYSAFNSYELEANLKTSLTGPGGTVSVDWGVTVESSGGKVTKNEVR